MKKVLLACMMCIMAVNCYSQFVPQPLNYPGPGYWPYYIAISDPQHVWVGTIHESGIPYASSARTSDGGNTWIHNSIPVPGEPYCCSICEWDASTCFYVFTDITEGGGSIWKTTDGGNTWTGLTTTQFEGGFANFFHAFTADTGVAMGDPVNGYFEIQVTNDGGATWSRVPSANIPEPLPDEWGLTDQYSAVGNSVWFATNLGRCFRSVDRGHNWSVTQVMNIGDGQFDVCFSSEMKGAFFNQDFTSSDIAITYDGGVTWDSVALPSGYYLMNMSNVGGFDGGFVFTGWKNSTDVFFTPDMFNHNNEIGSNLMSIGSVDFEDANTGWIGGGESGTNEILKFMGVLTSMNSLTQPQAGFSVIPNPSSGEVLIRLPDVSNALALKITDLSGRLIEDYPSMASEYMQLDASGFRAGVYLIQLMSGNRIVSCTKWVIKH